MKFKNNLFSFIGYFVIILFGIYASYLCLKSILIYEEDGGYIISHFVEKTYLQMSERVFWDGRFLPLQYYDYNLLLLLNIPYTNLNNLLFSYQILKFWMMLVVLILIFKDICKFNKLKTNSLIFLLCFWVLICNNQSLDILILLRHAEITMSLLIFLFIFAFQRAYFTNKTKYYVLAFISAFYLTYMKEVMFIPFCVMAGINLLFNRKNKKFNIFNILLIFNGILFLSLYFILGYNPEYNYLDIQGVPHYTTFFSYIQFLLKEPFILFVIILSLLRTFFLIIKKQKPSFYDVILISGIFNTFAYFVLSLIYSYYNIPTLAFSIPSLFYYINTTKRKVYFIPLIIFFIIFYFNNFSKHKVYLFTEKIEKTKEWNSFIKDKNICIYYKDWWEDGWWMLQSTIHYIKLLNVNIDIEKHFESYNSCDIFLFYQQNFKDENPFKKNLKFLSYFSNLEWGHVVAYEVQK